MTIKDSIKAEGYALGFSFVGFTTPSQPEHYSTYVNWLEAGHHGTMDYLATERNREMRSDPQLILPGCKTVVVLAANYPNPLNFAEPTESGLTGRIAAYAWPETDYHLVIPPLLEKLAQSMQTILDKKLAYKCYTDTGPILEKDFAQHAGLGWIGKNTCLISPKLGSFLFLAEILIDHSIEPDTPFTADRCGNCTQCIDTCPTHCILLDRTIDASRCISFLTIENKDTIPSAFRRHMENWVFGCDICQLVCPWNHRTRSISYANLFKQPPVPFIVDLQSEIQLSSTEFNRKYRESPIKRAKRRGYLRNTAVALGNSQNVEILDDLKQALLNEPEPLVRSHLIWALENIGTEAARETLLQAQRIEKDSLVLNKILKALRKFSKNT